MALYPKTVCICWSTSITDGIWSICLLDRFVCHRIPITIMSLLLVFILQTIASFIDKVTFPPNSWAEGRKSRRRKFVLHMNCLKTQNCHSGGFAAHQTEDRPEWDRSANWGNIKLFRKPLNRAQ